MKYRDKDGKEVTGPINAGTYKVILDIAAGDGYAAESDIDGGWTFTIQKADPLSFASQAVSITFGDRIDNELTNLSGAAVTYTSSNPAVRRTAKILLAICFTLVSSISLFFRADLCSF